jgi:hypothetical protein
VDRLPPGATGALEQEDAPFAMCPWKAGETGRYREDADETYTRDASIFA